MANPRMVVVEVVEEQEEVAVAAQGNNVATIMVGAFQLYLLQL
jgi:hypothetical protein